MEKYRDWKTLSEELTGARELIENADDEEMREMARLEVESLQQKLDATEDELKLLLVPSDPNDEKNVILEIRAGTGGDEASLFAAEMLAHVLAATPRDKAGSLKCSMLPNPASAVSRKAWR